MAETGDRAMAGKHSKEPDVATGSTPHPSPTLLGQNDNRPSASPPPLASTRTLRIEADDHISDFLVSPAEEEQLMALIDQISAAATRKEIQATDRAGWRTIAAVAGSSAAALLLAYLYI
jgi:hypothetical protein